LLKIEKHLEIADIFVSIGTSGVVYPAAAFVHWARGTTLELNLEPSSGASDFAESRQGPATQLVPVWVDEVLGNGGSGS
jgi:NAD-dependent deacetylase